jgi:hypothetical protein
MFSPVSDARALNGSTIADFTRVVEQTGILEREPLADQARAKD